MPITQWEKSDDKVDKVKALWNEGVTAQQGADILGVSRCAFLGIVHRLKKKGVLRGRLTTTSVRQVPKRRKIWTPGSLTSSGVKQSAQQVAEPKKKSEWVEQIHVDDAHIPRIQWKTVETLGDDDCRWPIGDPQHRDFHFCGGVRVPGKPYCGMHLRRSIDAPVVVSRASSDVKPPMEPIMQMETA